MNKSFNIAIADDNPQSLHSLYADLREMGCNVCILATCGRQLIDEIQESPCDLIAVKDELPDMSGTTVALEATKHRPVPAILLKLRGVSHNSRATEATNIMAILEEPVRKADLVATIPLVIQRFKELEQHRQEVRELANLLDALNGLDNNDDHRRPPHEETKHI